jgi:two-component system, NtrC family, sensor kinase
MRKGSVRERGRGEGRSTAGSTETTVDDEASSSPKAEASSSRKRILDLVPAAWLDRLLATAIDLPLLRGERAVVEAVVEAVAAIADGYAVGACFVQTNESTTTEQRVVARLPVGTRPLPAEPRPTRMFPSFTYEYTTPIAGCAAGCTLHIASSDDTLDHDGENERSPVVHLVERASLVLGRALGQVRAITSLQTGNMESRALDQRMRQADKLANFGQIAAGVVHELNNPLTSIVAYSDYLIRKAVARGEDGDAEDLERLRRIGESASRMLHFTRDLVSYARPSSGMAGPVLLHKVIERAIAFCEHVLSASDVRVETRYGSDATIVSAVDEQLVQVFVNLLTNAAQATRTDGGHVVVTTAMGERSAPKTVVVLVEDDGSGIPPEHLPHVFVPFFTTKGDRHGTGLGLSIVKSILEAHGGGIRVESEPGRGCRFVIELPLG